MSYFIQILHLLISLECITSLHQNIYTPYADTPTPKTNCQHDQAAELGTILSASPKSPIYRIFFLSSVGKRDNNDPYDLIYWCINYNWISNARFSFSNMATKNYPTRNCPLFVSTLSKTKNRIESNEIDHHWMNQRQSPPTTN